MSRVNARTAFLCLLGCAFGCAVLVSCLPWNAKTDNALILENAIPVFSDSLRPSSREIASSDSHFLAAASGSLNPRLLNGTDNPLRIPGSPLHFNLFSDQGFYGIIDEVHDYDAGHFTAKGHLIGAGDADFFISFFRGYLSAGLRATPWGSLRIRPAPIRSPTDAPSEAGATPYRAERLADVDDLIHEWPVEDGASPSVSVFPEPETVRLAKRAATYRVDLAMLYTAAAATAAGGDAAMKALIVASVDEANDALVASGVDLVLRLVDTASVAYVSTSNSDTDLVALKSTDDGSMDDLHARRTSVAADIVGLVIDTASNGAGSTYTMRQNKAAFASSAFFVITRGALDVGEYGIAQFVAKNMGCAADAKSAKKARGLFTYSRGYVFKGTGNVTYRTIVTGGTGTRIPYFSTPKVTKYGKPLGTTAANNAQTLAKTAPTFAAFQGDDEAPVLSIEYPTSGSTFGGSALSLGVLIADDQGVDSIAILDVTGGGSISLGQKRAPPWRFYLTGLDSGARTLNATAYDKGDHVTASATITVNMGPRPLNDTWTDTYLGDKGYNARVSASAETLTVIARNKGMQNFDDIQFIHKTFPASGRLRVQIKSITSHSEKARAGLMFRDSLSRLGRVAFFGIQESGAYSMGYRLFSNKIITYKAFSGTYADTVQLLLVRKGAAVNAFRKSGLAYTYLGKSNIVTQGTIYGGLAFASGDTGIADTLRAFALSADSSSNHPPLLTTTGVLAGTVYRKGDSVTLATVASDLDGLSTVSRVKYFTNTTVAAVDSTFPYSATFALPDSITILRSRIYDGSDSSEALIAVAVVDTSYRIVFPTKDTYMRDGRYTNSIYGDAQNLFVRTDATDNNFMSLLTFSLAGVDSISSAVLRLYGAISMADTAGVHVEVCPYADTTWVESGTTGMKHASFSADDMGTALDTLDMTSTQMAWYEIDVTEYVNTLKTDSATAVSFGLRSLDASTALGAFNSGEHIQGGYPQLILSHP